MPSGSGDFLEWLGREEPGDDFDSGESDGEGGDSVSGNGVCEFRGAESGGGREFDSAGGEGEDDSGEGREIPTAVWVKVRRRCLVEEVILLGKSGFCVLNPYLFVFSFSFFLNIFLIFF